MTCDIHLTDTTHCPERVVTTHNSTPHDRKVDTENMTAKGTRTSTLNILDNIRPLRYTNSGLAGESNALLVIILTALFCSFWSLLM